MARPHHLGKLKASVADWNEWRNKNPLILGDLRQAQLRGAVLRGANLRFCDLEGADLREADVRDANLYCAYLRFAGMVGADLRGASLRRAYLGRARLDQANLENADLSAANLNAASLAGANMRNADLNRTNLNSAILRDADLTGAKLAWTALADVDLGEVKGLEKVRHYAPSTIGIDTLYKSRGKISTGFLRRTGLPESFLADLPRLTDALVSSEYYSCFISYSHRNTRFARHLYDRMRKHGFRVWFAPEKMKGGRKTDEQLDEEIAGHDKLLLVLSEASMASKWVIYEIRRALRLQQSEQRQRLFPIRLAAWKAVRAWRCIDPDTGDDLAVEVRRFHIPDFRRWNNAAEFDKKFEALAAALRATEKRGFA
jgi:hypothetical protein